MSYSHNSSVTPQQVEQWVLSSSNPTKPEEQWQATNVLQEWTQKDGNVTAILFQLLVQTQQEQVHFYALTTLGRLELNEVERVQLRSYLLTQFPRSNPSPFLRNKAAMILTQHVLRDVPAPWNTVDQDLLQLAASSPELFLKTVETLLEDFQTNETDRDSIRRVKDVLKGNTWQYESGPTLLERLFDSVARILSASLQQNGQSTDLQVLALQTVKGFFMWTELSFLGKENANHVLEMLLISLQPSRPASVQLTALEAWQEWTTSASTIQENNTSIQTDQDPKLPIMMALLEKLHEYNLLPYQGESDAEIEVVIAVAKLINIMGLEVLPLFEDIVQKSKEDSPVFKLFNQVLDLFFRAFAYDDIDVSTAVLPLAARITVTMEQEAESQQQRMGCHLPQMLNTLYRQLKYPEDFEYDYEDEDDAEEEVYRAELCKLYTKLVRAAPSVCLQFVCEAMAQLLSGNITEAAAPDLEATLRLLYHYCEGVRPPPGMKVVMRNETFCSLLVALHSSSIANHPHREVLCLYYDTAVRYYPIYQQKDHTPLLSKILAAMSGTQGLQHSHPRVRSRSCYLLLRLVKSVAALLRPFVETAVSGILGLLSNSSLQLRSDDTLYLFETIGILLGKTGLEATDQQRYLTQVMTPHVRSIEQVLATPDLQRDAEHYGEQLSGSIAAIAHLSKGFPKPCDQVQVVLAETVNITLTVLEALPMSEHVRNKSMVLLQRMIQCVGAKVMAKMPRFLQLLIEHCTSEDVLFVAQLFNQLCIKFKERAVEGLDAALLPFLRKCQSLVPSEDEIAVSDIPPHLRTVQLSIKKLTFVVLQHIVTHNATALLTSQTNVGNFEMYLQTMSEGAIRESDPVVKKTCIRFFRELIDQWAGRPDSDLYRRGLMNYVCQTFIPGMINVILEPSFDERDALQARNVSELASVFFSIKARSDTEDYFTHGVLAALNGGGRVPANILEAFRTASSAKEMESCLHEMLKFVKKGGSAP